MRSALYKYGRPMWNLAIMKRPRSIASETATAGERGRVLVFVFVVVVAEESGCGEIGFGGVAAVCGVVVVDTVVGSGNLRPGGRFSRHWPSWWWSSTLTAG